MPATLVWDGECGFCRAWARVAHRRLPADVEVVPYQSAGLGDLGLTEDACRIALQWVDATGIRTGARAVARALWAIGGVWAAVALLLDLSPVRPLARAGYQWVADNRSWLPVPRSRGHAEVS